MDYIPAPNTAIQLIAMYKALEEDSHPLGNHTPNPIVITAQVNSTML